MLIARTDNHRGLAATVVACVLALSGVACIGVAMAGQQGAPQQPPLSAGESPSASTSANAAATGQPTPVPSTSPTKAATLVLPASAPTALRIPAIGVRTPLLSLGLTAKGALQTPAKGPDYDKAGWYRHSPTPGAIGPAVIAGHIDSAANGPSVFFRLGALRRNDTVWVSRADGSVAVFAVTEVRRYPKSRFPTQLVYGNTAIPTLRLITCGGSFDRSSGHYRDNIVVFATLIRATGVAQPGIATPAGVRRAGAGVPR